jgi:hypothetical protein
MKKLLFILSFLFIPITFFAQVGIGTTTPHPSAILDVNVDNLPADAKKGFLPPRITEDERNAITNPGTGLIIYCTDCGPKGQAQVYAVDRWTNVIGGAAAAAPLVPGDSFQGGLVTYVLQSGDPGYDPNIEHGLIAPATDQGTAPWGCRGTSISSTSNLIGTGAQNTAAIVAGCNDTNFAAKVCDDLNLNGFDDWYLPSQDELQKLLTNQAAVGGFSGNYQSSTESTANVGLGKNFTNGTDTFFTKDATQNVRCVRSF